MRHLVLIAALAGILPGCAELRDTGPFTAGEFYRTQEARAKLTEDIKP